VVAILTDGEGVRCNDRRPKTTGKEREEVRLYLASPLGRDGTTFYVRWSGVGPLLSSRAWGSAASFGRRVRALCSISRCVMSRWLGYITVMSWTGMRKIRRDTDIPIQYNVVPIRMANNTRTRIPSISGSGGTWPRIRLADITCSAAVSVFPFRSLQPTKSVKDVLANSSTPPWTDHNRCRFRHEDRALFVPRRTGVILRRHTKKHIDQALRRACREANDLPERRRGHRTHPVLQDRSTCTSPALRLSGPRRIPTIGSSRLWRSRPCLKRLNSISFYS
jgi:hypothetical protein